MMRCDKAMAFSFYALIYFLPISIALSESFTGMALFFWFLKRGVVFYQNLKTESVEKALPSTLKIFGIFLKSFKPVASYLDVPIVLFLLFNLVSVITSQFRMVSLEGFLGKVLQGAFIYFNFIECMNSKKRLKIFLNIFFVSSFLVSINGLYQYYFGQEFIRGHIFEGRISSSFRHANDFGAYLVIVNTILLSVLHLDIEQISHLRKYNKNGTSSGRFSLQNTRFVVYIIILVTTLSCLGLTYSRGAWIALLVAVLTLSFLRRRTILLNAVIMILFLGISYPQLQAQRNVGLIQVFPIERQKKEPLGLLETIEESIVSVIIEHGPAVKEDQKAIEETGRSISNSEESFSHTLWKKILKIIKGIETSGRITYWQEAWRMIKEYPIFGVGVNAYSLAAPQYKISWGGYPHNCYLQMLAEIGIPGFFCFIWLLYRLFKNSVRKLKDINDPFCRMILLGAMAAFGGFLLHSFFDTFFYSVQLGSFMWIMMGFIVAVQNVKDDHRDNNYGGIAVDYKIKSFRIRKTIVHIISIILIVYIFLFFYVKRRVLNPQYARVFYNWSVQCVINCPPKEQLKYFKRAIHYNPNFSDAHFQLGKVYQKLGNDEKAVESYRRATELDHTHWRAYFQMGYHYFKKRELSHALRYLAQAYRQEASSEVNYYLGRIYEERKDYKQAISYYQLIMDRQSQQYDRALVRTGALYHILGLTDDTIKKIKELRAGPRLDWADQLQRFIETNQYPEFLKDWDF